VSTKIFIAFTSFTVITMLITVVILGLTRPETPIHTNSRGEAHELVVYRSPTCGCCTSWESYMKIRGYKIESVDVKDADLPQVKKDNGIPDDLYSCHTTVVNDGQYFIEGLVPEEAISRLLEEQPDIAGIGLPGMPSGSPGMPGAQTMPFEIMQVDDNQKMSIYEVI